MTESRATHILPAQRNFVFSNYILAATISEKFHTVEFCHFVIHFLGTFCMNLHYLAVSSFVLHGMTYKGGIVRYGLYIHTLDIYIIYIIDFRDILRAHNLYRYCHDFYEYLGILRLLYLRVSLGHFKFELFVERP